MSLKNQNSSGGSGGRMAASLSNLDYYHDAVGTADSQLFPGNQYVPRRANDRAKKDEKKKKKSKRRSSHSTTSSTTTASGSSNTSSNRQSIGSQSQSYRRTSFGNRRDDLLTSSIQEENEEEEEVVFGNRGGGDRNHRSPSNKENFRSNTTTPTRATSSYRVDPTSYAESKYILKKPTTGIEEQTMLLSSDGMMPNDPLANGFQNDEDEIGFPETFEDELDDIQMGDSKNVRAEALLTVDSKHGKRKRRRSCCVRLVVCLLVVVGGLMIAAYFVGGVFRSKGPKIQDVKPVVGVHLKLVCAEGMDLGPGQEAKDPLLIPEECQDICLTAECCWKPDSEYECSPETQKHCDGYMQPCSIMLEGSVESESGSGSASVSDHSTTKDDPVLQQTVPSAPQTLKTVCVPTGEDFFVPPTCVEQCKQASCCWNQTETRSCTPASDIRCPPYVEYCSFLNDHPQNNNNNNAAAAAGTTGSSISTGGASSTMAPAPEGIHLVCDPTEIQTIGIGKCLDLCNAAKCCWKLGVESCSATEDACDVYTNACSFLNEDLVHDNNNNNNDGIPTPPSNLQILCDPSEIEAKGADKCQEACEPASCCWSTAEAGCIFASCKPYAEHCVILNNLSALNLPGGGGSGGIVMNNIQPAVTNLTARCSREGIVNAGSEEEQELRLGECEQECMQGACCWDGDFEPCLENPLCKDYLPCAEFADVVLNGLDTSQNSGSQGTTSTPTQTSANSIAAAEIAEVCKEQAFLNRILCEEKCEPGACCRTIDICPDDVDCSIYEPCRILDRRNLRRV